MQRVNRVKPAMPVKAYKTYGIKAEETGTDGHWIEVSCEEVECKTQAMGWMTVVDEATPLGQKQAYYIRRVSGRPFREERVAGQTTFHFPPGAECFQTHYARTARPELYIVRGGDWRGSVGKSRVHSKPEHWVEDFAEHQDKVQTRINAG